MDCPPYWLLATCAMICVAMLQAVEKLCGRSIKRAGDNGAVLQHVLQVHQIAVVHMLRKVVACHGSG